MVGRYDTSDGIAHGYRLSDSVLTTIDYPASRFTVATGINPSGHIVGRYQTADGRFHGFTLVDGQFTTVDHPDALSIQAMAINAEGEIAGYYESVGGTLHGFLLSEGIFTTIDPPGSLATGGPGGVLGINGREIVGLYRTDPAASGCGCDGVRGFIFKDGTYTSFDFPAAISTGNSGINRRGEIVGNYKDVAGRRHGFLASKGAEE